MELPLLVIDATKWNDQTVKSSDDPVTILARSGSVGQAVTLTILRDGKQTQVQVILGVRPSSFHNQ